VPPFLLPTEENSIRRSLDDYFERNAIRPSIEAEFDDSALLKVFGQQGLGLFAAPSVVEDVVKQQYGLVVVGRIPEVRERFYAVSVERRLRHPAVLAITKAARSEFTRSS
jgi:LysR family transcriptional activator of nhaA